MNRVGLYLLVVFVGVSFVPSASLSNGLVPSSRSNGRIIGGSPITIEDAPYMAQLVYYGAHYCGGSIIAEDVILTAAHCINNLLNKLTKVRAGTTYRTSGTLLPIRKMLAHEEFVNVDTGKDVGLIWLESPLTFSNTVQKIQLPLPTDRVVAGDIAVVTGWGYMNLKGYMPNQLMSVEVPIYDQEECERDYAVYDATVAKGTLCAGYPQGGKDACSGDSGGPLRIGTRQVGIVSTGIWCAYPRIPGVYTDLDYYVDWIALSIWQDRLSTNL